LLVAGYRANQKPETRNKQLIEYQNFVIKE